MAGHVINPATKFEDPTTILSWVTSYNVSHWLPLIPIMSSSKLLPYLIHGSFGCWESTSQTASRSVEPFLQGSPARLTQAYTQTTERATSVETDRSKNCSQSWRCGAAIYRRSWRCRRCSSTSQSVCSEQVARNFIIAGDARWSQLLIGCRRRQQTQHTWRHQWPAVLPILNSPHPSTSTSMFSVSTCSRVQPLSSPRSREPQSSRSTLFHANNFQKLLGTVSQKTRHQTLAHNFTKY